VSVKRADEVYQVELVAGVVPMDRDFVLSWQPVVGSAPKAATFRETIDGEDYVLLMILPPEQEYATPAFPRDMVFVIDTSGSMQGTSIEQARSSLHKALGSLRPEDRFNLIEFNGAWSRLYSGMQRVDPHNLQQAGEWVSRLVAGGGTNMLPALEQALITEDSEGYLKHIIFITDGAVGNEAVLFETIVQRLGNARLFPVGIGSAPNSFFMRQAAKFGRGTYTHIGTVREVEEKMDGLFRKIDSPIATDLSIAWPGQVEAYPENIPAIYKGEPLLVVARAPQLRGEIHIRGMTAEMPWHQSLSLDTKSSQLGVGTLWARKKIEALEEAETRGRDAALVKKDIIEVALTHSLISRYTSLVAVEEIVSRMPQDLLKTTAVPNALANGQVLSAMYPRTATRATMSMIVGLISILFAGVVLLMRRMVA
jgi:Ca-activated chloride channel family protein